VLDAAEGGGGGGSGAGAGASSFGDPPRVHVRIRINGLLRGGTVAAIGGELFTLASGEEVASGSARLAFAPSASAAAVASALERLRGAGAVEVGLVDDSDGTSYEGLPDDVVALFLRMARAARAAAAHAAAADPPPRFAPFAADTLSDGAAHLVTRYTVVGDAAAAALIVHEAVQRCLREVYANGATVASIKASLDEGLATFAVNVGGGARPSSLSLGGFETTEQLLPSLAALLQRMHEVCEPLGPRDAQNPPPPEVPLDDVLRRMEKDGKVFSEVREYGVYLVLVYVRGVLDGAYAGSAGRAGCTYLLAERKRTGERNTRIEMQAGVGDSNLGIYLARKLAAVEAGALEMRDVTIHKLIVGFHVPVGAYPEAFGGAHCVGLWAELRAIMALWQYKACLNIDTNPLKMDDEGFDSDTGAAAGASGERRAAPAPRPRPPPSAYSRCTAWGAGRRP
jgi:hypothetical protein